MSDDDLEAFLYVTGAIGVAYMLSLETQGKRLWYKVMVNFVRVMVVAAFAMRVIRFAS